MREWRTLNVHCTGHRASAPGLLFPINYKGTEMVRVLYAETSYATLCRTSLRSV